MSKWEDKCLCASDNGLFILNRQLSIVVAGLLFLFFSFFIVGYFLGKRSAAEQFTQKMCQESFPDQIYTSVISAHEEIKNESSVIPEKMAQTDTEVSDISPVLSLGEQSEGNNVTKSAYYAQLIGFGTEKAAQKFVQKLALKNVETFVKKRTSKTAKGRTIYWYQVVTPPYNDKDELSSLINRLAKEEKLSGVYIGAC